MPTWTCQKCGQRVENFGWGSAPWKSHRCVAAVGPKDETQERPVPEVPAPAAAFPMVVETPATLPVPVPEKNEDVPASPAGTARGFFNKAKRSDLSGFL